MKTCAFTGHRPKDLGYPESDERCAALKEKLRSLIVKLIEEEGVTHFISGMAQGVDMYAAEIVLELKKQYPQITLECAIPYERQAAYWSESSAKPLLLHRRAVRPRDDVTAAVHAGLSAETEPIYGRPSGYRAGGLEWQSQWDWADGVVCQRDREAGLDHSAGYPGSAIKEASLRWQRGFFFLIVPEHLSVSFADSSPQGEPPTLPPLEGRCRHWRRRGGNLYSTFSN